MTEGTARCGYCREAYSLGASSGTLFIYYPNGESAYWQHVRDSTLHQRMLDHQALDTHDMMEQAPRILKKIRSEQAKVKRKEKKLAADQG